MKNKKLIYVLLPLVLVIWGVILFRVLSAVGGKDDFAPIQRAPNIALSETLDSVDYQLKLDYPDPFLKRVSRSRGPVAANNPNGGSSKKRNGKVVKTVKKLPLKWPKVDYMGIIRNKNEETPLCLIQVDGKPHFLRLNEEIEELKLLAAYQDSIKFRFKDKENRMFYKSK